MLDIDVALPGRWNVGLKHLRLARHEAAALHAGMLGFQPGLPFRTLWPDILRRLQLHTILVYGRRSAHT